MRATTATGLLGAAASSNSKFILPADAGIARGGRFVKDMSRYDRACGDANKCLERARVVAKERAAEKYRNRAIAHALSQA